MKVRSKSSRVYYLYGLSGTCVLSSPNLANLKGLGGSSVEFLETGDIVVIYGILPDDEYSAESIREKVRDLNWLEKRSTEHYHVQEALASSQCPVIPFKFCTIFKTKQKVKKFVSARLDFARDVLNHLRGKQEWGVKVFRNRNELKKNLRGLMQGINSSTTCSENKPDGQSYLLRKKSMQDLETLVSKYSTSNTRILIDNLKAISVESRQNETFAVPDRKDEEMLANFAFLLKIEDIEIFKSKVDEFNNLHSARGGLYACISGPWLPYNFVNGPEVEQLG